MRIDLELDISLQYAISRVGWEFVSPLNLYEKPSTETTFVTTHAEEGFSPLNYSPSEVETILCAGILDIETLALNDAGVCVICKVFLQSS